MPKKQRLLGFVLSAKQVSAYGMQSWAYLPFSKVHQTWDVRSNLAWLSSRNDPTPLADGDDLVRFDLRKLFDLLRSRPFHFD